MVQMKFKAQADQLDVQLDVDADVLYVSSGWNGPIEGTGQPDGVQLDFALDTNNPCGVTVIGFSHYGWPERLPELATLVAEHLTVSRNRALTDLKAVLIAT